MANLSQLRTHLRKMVQDIDGNTLSAGPANQLINNALEDFSNQTEQTFSEYGWFITAKKQRYDLPADHVKIKTLHWYQNGEFEIEYLSPKEFQEFGLLDRDRTSSAPRYYTLIDNDIYLGPAPSATSNTSTLSISASSSISTLTVADGTKFHSPAGFIDTDATNEQMNYQNISGNSLLLCLRGQGRTTAQAITVGKTIRRLDMVAVMHYNPKSLSAAGDTPVLDARWHYWFLEKAISEAFMLQGRTQDAVKHLQYYEAKVKTAKREIEKRQRDQLTTVRLQYY